jgi:hypothetical protein
MNEGQFSTERPGGVFERRILQAAVSKILKAAPEEVLGGHARNDFRIRHYVDQPRNLCAAVADNDCRNAQGHELLDAVNVPRNYSLEVERFKSGPSFLEATRLPIN